MNVIFMSKNFKKVSSDERKAVEKSVKKLMDKINQYEHDGVPFEIICNDDSVKYDAFANGYYTYKAQSQRFPLRILYRFVRADGDSTIQVHMSFCKKYNDNRYISEFERYAACH